MVSVFNNITVVILNYNSSNDTLELFDQLKKFYKDITVIVVDNNSSIEDKENLALKIEEEAIIYNSENLGYAGGNNVGLKRAIKNKAEYVWILNPDIRIDSNTLPILLETIQVRNELAAVGPRICYREDPSKIYSDGGLINKELGYVITHINSDKNIADIKNWDALQKVDYVNGSAMLVKLDVFKKIGFMLEDFFLYFEETEWCLRASTHKYKFMTNTNAQVYHKASNKGVIYYFYMTRNRLLLAKHKKAFYLRTVWAVSKLILQDIVHDLKNLKLTQMTKSKIKGVLSGLFGKLKK